MPNHVPAKASDIITKLMVKDPASRLGSQGGAEEVMSHPWFSTIDWAFLRQQRLDLRKFPLMKVKLNELENVHQLLTAEHKPILHMDNWYYDHA